MSLFSWKKKKAVAESNHDLLVKYPNINIHGTIESNGCCIIDSRVHGLFACFYCILYGLYICEQEGLTPIVVMGDNHIYYEKKYGENVFGYFFEQHVSMPENAQLPRITVNNPGAFLEWVRISTNEKITAHALIEKYFLLKDDVQKIVNDFTDQHFKNSRMLAVHYRGRDKVTETQLLDFDYYLQKIRYAIDNNVCDKIFFCSDELPLRKVLMEMYPGKVCTYALEGNYEKASMDKTAGLHFSTDTNYLQAKDALIECYLLSKCTMLMSSHRSSLSLFATFLNPEIMHVILEP